MCVDNDLVRLAEAEGVLVLQHELAVLLGPFRPHFGERLVHRSRKYDEIAVHARIVPVQ